MSKSDTPHFISPLRNFSPRSVRLSCISFSNIKYYFSCNFICFSRKFSVSSCFLLHNGRPKSLQVYDVYLSNEFSRNFYYVKSNSLPKVIFHGLEFAIMGSFFAPSILGRVITFDAHERTVYLHSNAHCDKVDGLKFTRLLLPKVITPRTPASLNEHPRPRTPLLNFITITWPWSFSCLV